MLNEIHIEGVVAKSWTYGGTRFTRIACYPDPGRSLKRGQGGRDEPEYVSLRFEPPLALAAAGLRSGDRVRASGFLASREYDISLTRFCNASVGDEEARRALRELAEGVGEEVRKPHVLNEVNVERFAVLHNGH